MTTILTISNKSKDTVIKETVRVLHAGGLVVFPSDTVYGLLVDATNEKAVEKLISFKNRAPGKAISVFVSDFEMLQKQLRVTSEKLRVIEQLLPGPFTIVLPSQHQVSRLLESEKETLGVRIPDYSLVNELVGNYGKPITATSANLGGRHPHHSIESLLHQLPQAKQELIDLIIDAGKLLRNKPSTVIDLTEPEMKILRQGDIVFDSTERYISKTPAQTRKVGSHIVNTLIKQDSGKPLVIVLKGDLGAGKTEMTRGIAAAFGIEKIVSPTFVVYYEYDIRHPDQVKHVEGSLPACRQASTSFGMTMYKKLIHVDLYNIQEEEEFEHLGLEEYLKPGHVMVVEWGEKLGKLYDSFKEKAEVVFVEIVYEGEKGRIIQVQK